MTQEQWIAGRYRCLYKLGRGGFSEVFLAEDVRLGNRKVALKRVAAHFIRDNERIQKFQQEAQIIGHLTNPYTVRAFDFGKDEDGRYYIAMEYVQGETLHDILKREHRLSIERSVKIAIQMLDGLSEAHRMGVIHRDLKPKNIMLVPQRHGDLVKILDFGVARILRGDLDPEKDEWTLVGTATYMAPEQAQGLPVSSASDIYSVGVILYHLLSGRPPFTSKEDPVAVMIHHALSEAPPLRDTFPELDLPQELDALVLRALQKKPEARFQQANEFCNRLEQFWETWFLDQSHSVIDEAETFKHALDPDEQAKKRSPRRASWHSPDDSGSSLPSANSEVLPDHTLSRNPKKSVVEEDLTPEPPTVAQGSAQAYTKETKAIGVSWTSSKDGLVGLSGIREDLSTEDLSTEKKPLLLHEEEDASNQTHVEMPAASSHFETLAILDVESEPTAPKPKASPKASQDPFHIRSREMPAPTSVMTAPDLNVSNWLPPSIKTAAIPPGNPRSVTEKSEPDTVKEIPQDTDKNNATPSPSNLVSARPSDATEVSVEAIPAALASSPADTVSRTRPPDSSSEWEVPTVGEASIDYLQKLTLPGASGLSTPAGASRVPMSPLPPPSLHSKGSQALHATLQDVFPPEEDMRSTQEYGDEVETEPDAPAARSVPAVPNPSVDSPAPSSLYAVAPSRQAQGTDDLLSLFGFSDTPPPQKKPPSLPSPNLAVVPKPPMAPATVAYAELGGETSPAGFAAMVLPSAPFLPPVAAPVPTWSPQGMAPPPFQAFSPSLATPGSPSPLPSGWPAPAHPSFSKANGIAPPPPFPNSTNTPPPFPVASPYISAFENQPAATWSGKGLEEKTFQAFASPFVTPATAERSRSLFPDPAKDEEHSEFVPSLRWRWVGILGGFVFVFGLLVLLASVGGNKTEQKRIMEEEAFHSALQEGDREVAANSYLKAYLSYRRALLLQPNSEDAKRRMLLAKQDLDAALQLRQVKHLIRKRHYWQAYHLVLKLDPKTSSYAQRNTILQSLQPHLIESLAQRVQSLLQEKNWTQAVASCKRLAHYAPNHPLLQRPCRFAAKKAKKYR